MTVIYRSATSVRITWTNNVAATSLILQRSTNATTGFTQFATPAANATTHDDPTHTLSTQYYYRLIAIVGAQSSNPSPTGTATPPPIPTAPPAPTGVATSNVTQTTMRVAWSYSGTTADGFIVERLTNYTGYEYQQIADLPASARTFDDTCLRPAGTPYLYRISAYNEAGRASATTPNNTLTANPSTAPATGPTMLRSAAVSANSYRIEWNNTCSTADRLLIEVSQNNGAYTSVLPAPGFFISDATWFLYTNLQPGVTYRFRASAGNALGFSAVTAPIVVGPIATPAGGASSFGIYADYDNTRVYADIVPSITNTVYASGQLTAGCFWLYNSFLGMQDFNCYSAAIHFPLSGTTTANTSFNLTGKTIDRAVLVLSTSALAVPPPTNLNVSAISSAWSTGTLTGNTSLNLYAAGSSVNAAPGSIGAYAIDVTTIVRNWVAGTAMNNGFLIEDANYVFPNGNFIRTSFFFSTDTFGGVGNEKNKPTLWVDSH